MRSERGWFGGGDPYGVLCYRVGDRGCREWLAGPPAIHRSSLRDGGLWGEAWVVPGQRAGSGKAAAGFRSPRAFGRLDRRGREGSKK